MEEEVPTCLEATELALWYFSFRACFAPISLIRSTQASGSSSLARL